MALQEIICPDCYGLGETQHCYDPACRKTCERCWGALVIEVQRGPQDPDDEVSNRPRAGSNWAIFARWEQDREQQG